MSEVVHGPLVGVVNAGSSSVKFSFYEGEGRILTGQVDGIGAHPSAKAAGPGGEEIAPPTLGAQPPRVPSEALPAILPWARERLGDRRLAALAIASSTAGCVTRAQHASRQSC
jgi:acetate kinase